jgi:hypothetical protein
LVPLEKRVQLRFGSELRLRALVTAIRWTQFEEKFFAAQPGFEFAFDESVGERKRR